VYVLYRHPQVYLLHHPDEVLGPHLPRARHNVAQRNARNPGVRRARHKGLYPEHAAEGFIHHSRTRETTILVVTLPTHLRPAAEHALNPVTMWYDTSHQITIFDDAQRGPYGLILNTTPARASFFTSHNSRDIPIMPPRPGKQRPPGFQRGHLPPKYHHDPVVMHGVVRHINGYTSPHCTVCHPGGPQWKRAAIRHHLAALSYPQKHRPLGQEIDRLPEHYRPSRSLTIFTVMERRPHNRQYRLLTVPRAYVPAYLVHTARLTGHKDR
jgi:hypothetical protein